MIPLSENAIRSWQRRREIIARASDGEDYTWYDLLTTSELADLRSAKCGVCEAETIAKGDYYMVHDEVWAAAGMDEGFLCIPCLEARLDRRITAADLTDAPVNIGIRLRLSRSHN